MTLDELTTKQYLAKPWWARQRIDRILAREARPVDRPNPAGTNGGRRPADDREWTAEEMAEARAYITKWRKHKDRWPEPTPDQRAAFAAYDRLRYQNRRET